MIGAVMVAHNGPDLDYVKLARFNAAQIRRHLGWPVALITSADIEEHAEDFDEIILVDRPEAQTRHFDDVGKVTAWFNTDRHEAYDKSPWSHTVMLDADYVINSDTLKFLDQCPKGFLAPRSAFDVTGVSDFSGHETIGRSRLPMYWATVISFDRGQLSRDVFDAWSMIAQSWPHYVKLHRIRNYRFRNDFAMSMALHLVHAHVSADIPCLPISLATVTPDCAMHRQGDVWNLTYTTAQGRAMRLPVQGMDLHITGKKTLQEIIDAS